MKHWNDLTPLEQGNYNKGVIVIHEHNWRCYWKWLDRDNATIEVYSEYDDWRSYSASYVNLSNVFSWK